MLRGSSSPYNHQTRWSSQVGNREKAATLDARSLLTLPSAQRQVQFRLLEGVYRSEGIIFSWQIRLQFTGSFGVDA